eukprot:301196-Prymnesium_polylepis.1
MRARNRQLDFAAYEAEAEAAAGKAAADDADDDPYEPSEPFEIRLSEQPAEWRPLAARRRSNFPDRPPGAPRTAFAPQAAGKLNS